MINQVLQGDCLELMKDIPDGSVDMILADLPYGITKNKWDTVIPLDKLWHQYERVIKERGVIVLTASQPFTSMLITSNQKLFKYDIVWHKRTIGGMLNAKKMPLRTHETILIFYKKLPTYNPIKTFTDRKTGIKSRAVSSSNYRETKKAIKYVNNGSRYPTSVLEITGVVNNSKEKVSHPTQKPVKLMEWLIKTYTNEGDLVLDNVAGSGTTGVACQNLNRNFILMEQEPEYVEIIKKRLQND